MSEENGVYDVLLKARAVIKIISAGESPALLFPVKPQGQVMPAISKMMTRSPKNPYTIQFLQQDVPVSTLRGKLVRYQEPDYAKIFFSLHQNHCWRRFVMCKEMAHIILDTNPEQRTTNVESHIQGLISEMPNISHNKALDSEYDAMILALEILMPWPLRKSLYSMKDEGATDMDIAKLCLVPEKFVSPFMSRRYREFSTGAHELLDAD